MKLLLATRSTHKLKEILAILRDEPEIELVDLNAAAVPVSGEEDLIEAFDTFEANAVAKAIHFHAKTGLPTVADDSGLVVDALDGAPGVRSKRFAPVAAGVRGEERDRESLEHLLGQLSGVDLRHRTARYVCVAAFVTTATGKPGIFRGTVEGLILGHPRGEGGFGYDPVFYHRGLGRTFAEIAPEEKDRASHRGQAFRELTLHLGAGGRGSREDPARPDGPGAAAQAR